jgi:phage shock protein A
MGMRNEKKSYASLMKMYEAAFHNQTKQEKSLRDKISKQEKKISKGKGKQYVWFLFIYVLR